MWCLPPYNICYILILNTLWVSAQLVPEGMSLGVTHLRVNPLGPRLSDIKTYPS
jgi:hypothetical protein